MRLLRAACQRRGRPAWSSPTTPSWRRGPTGSCSSATAASSTRPRRRPGPSRCSTGPADERERSGAGRTGGRPTGGATAARAGPPGGRAVGVAAVPPRVAPAGAGRWPCSPWPWPRPVRRRRPPTTWPASAEDAEFGTANHRLELDGPDPPARLAAPSPTPRSWFGTIEVIGHRAVAGSRARSTRSSSAPRIRDGPTARRCWRCVEGRYPTGAGEVALTDAVADDLRRRRRRHARRSTAATGPSSASSRTPATWTTSSRSSPRGAPGRRSR